MMFYAHDFSLISLQSRLVAVRVDICGSSRRDSHTAGACVMIGVVLVVVHATSVRLWILLRYLEITTPVTSKYDETWHASDCCIKSRATQSAPWRPALKHLTCDISDIHVDIWIYFNIFHLPEVRSSWYGVFGLHVYQRLSRSQLSKSCNALPLTQPQWKLNCFHNRSHCFTIFLRLPAWESSVKRADAGSRLCISIFLSLLVLIEMHLCCTSRTI